MEVSSSRPLASVILSWVLCRELFLLSIVFRSYQVVSPTHITMTNGLALLHVSCVLSVPLIRIALDIVTCGPPYSEVLLYLTV